MSSSFQILGSRTEFALIAPRAPTDLGFQTLQRTWPWTCRSFSDINMFPIFSYLFLSACVFIPCHANRPSSSSDQLLHTPRAQRCPRRASWGEQNSNVVKTVEVIEVHSTYSTYSTCAKKNLLGGQLVFMWFMWFMCSWARWHSAICYGEGWQPKSLTSMAQSLWFLTVPHCSTIPQLEKARTRRMVRCLSISIK